MKRFFCLLLAAFLMMSLIGCAGSSETNPSAGGVPTIPVAVPTEPEIINPPEPTMPEIVETEPTEPTEPTECTHNYADATCDDPAKCTLCGETKGDALGHNYEGGTCDTAGKCTRCGKAGDKPSGHDEGWGGKCSVCGEKTDRYYDIQAALKAAERYPKYISINYDLICNEYDLYNLTKDLKYFNDAHENTLEIYEYLKKIVDKCEDYKELDMLTKECRELILEMPTVPGSTGSSAIRSYISDAKSFARKASRLSVIYNVLCDNYELPGV